MARVGGLHSGMSSILINSALWLTLLFTIPAVNAGLIDVLMLAPLALIVLAAFEAVAALPGAGQMWPAIEAAASRLIEVVSARPLIATSSEPRFSNARAVEDGSSTSLPGCSPEVAMRRVSFAYPGRLIPSLREVSLRIEPGRCLGVVGPSGAGKSTIANLLLRFWEYDSGEIHFGGSPIRALEPERVRSQIGYLSQHPYLFDTSIYENLRLARRGASRADVENAASRARIHDFIIGLPQGYDTLIGEHGARLSAGERQRLGVARLLLKNAPLLILDEPTANLDALTEQDVLSTLFALRASKTALLITHRLVGMERLDEIVVMDHGQIVQRGTHSSLLAGGGLYGRLWRLQSRQSALPPGPLAGTG
jgi:ATP-binding cassette subfamily C protein CydC